MNLATFLLFAIAIASIKSVVADDTVTTSLSSGQAFQMTTSWGTYDQAKAQCAQARGAISPYLAGYNTSESKLVLQDMCAQYGCWVDGVRTTNSINMDLCPFIYIPRTSPPPTEPQYASCATMQRFVCVIIAPPNSPPSPPNPPSPPPPRSPPPPFSPPPSPPPPPSPTPPPPSPPSPSPSPPSPPPPSPPSPPRPPRPPAPPAPPAPPSPSPPPSPPPPPPPSPPTPPPLPPSPPPSPPSPPSPPLPPSPPPHPSPPPSPPSPPPSPPLPPSPTPPPSPPPSPPSPSPPPSPKPSPPPPSSPPPPTPPPPPPRQSPPPPAQQASPPWSTPPLAQNITVAAYPGQSDYQLLSQLSMVVAVHLVHLPGTDSYLYMERPSGYHPDNSREIAGSLDLSKNLWTHLETPDGLFCSGHTIMANGSVVIVGGHKENAGFPSGLQSIRTYTPGTPALIKATTMLWPRWYPTATLLPDNQILIMGGTQNVGAGTASNPYYEIWNPLTPTITQQLPVDPGYLLEVKQNYYPFNFVMPNGDMFNWCNRIGWIMDPYSGTYKVRLPGRPLSDVSPSTVYTTQYPYTGTAVMLMLRPEDDYTVEIMQMGGQDVRANSNLSITACSESLRLRITAPSQAKPSYFFNGGWVQEFMGSPRVMPDSILLPNGLVILMSGATQGLAGDAASGGGSRSDYPNFFAELYDPYAPPGQRWSTLARSQIARLYHSTAALTTNGTILVTGCDRCSKFTSNLPFSMPPAKAEYRNEIFHPPFWYDFAGKPSIVDMPGNAGFNEVFTITYTGEQDPNVPVTSVVLVAPSSCTHSFNTNQRVVKLAMIQNDPGSHTLTVMSPPSPNHAPPQMYMLFLLNGNTYSKAKWITLAQ